MVNEPMQEKTKVKNSTFWLENCPGTNFPKLTDRLSVDVAVLGGGIVGVTTAKLLKESGLNVALIESDRIVKDVTAGTTAKISAAPNIIYANLISSIGQVNAQKFADANMKSLEMISEIVEKEDIDCDFQRLPLYIFNESSEDRETIEKELTASKELGLPVSYTEDVPLPFETGPALKYDNQAQFHPRKYLLGLVQGLNGESSYVFEKSQVISIKDGVKKEIITNQGSIHAEKVVITTHTPVYDPDNLKNHLHPARSHVLGLYLNNDFPDGMFVDSNPVHTYRSTPTEKGKLVIVAGEHSPVKVEDENIYYDRLENYARQHLNVKSIEFHWSSTDSKTDDGLPLIGMTSKEGIFVSTGLGFWGMTNGTTAAMVNSDLINEKTNEYSKLFNPLRFKR